MTDPRPRTGDIPVDLSQRLHRLLIGCLGLVLPLLLYLVAGLRPTTGLAPWELLPSVSAYYYTGASGFFVGMLFALALFLFAYPGYKGVLADQLVACLGGVGALGVCLFPTAAPEGVSEPSWWTPELRTIHYVSAVLLFSAFILFSVWLFRKSNIPNPEGRPLEKRARDAVCLACGIVMTGAVLWTGTSYFTHASIFWPEAIAMVAFAVSWLAKGEAHAPLLGLVRRLTSKH